MSGKTDENKYNTYISKDETKCKQIFFFRNTLTEVACLYMQILSFNKNNFKIFRHIG